MAASGPPSVPSLALKKRANDFVVRGRAGTVHDFRASCASSKPVSGRAPGDPPPSTNTPTPRQGRKANGWLERSKGSAHRASVPMSPSSSSCAHKERKEAEWERVWCALSGTTLRLFAHPVDLNVEPEQLDCEALHRVSLIHLSSVQSSADGKQFILTTLTGAETHFRCESADDVKLWMLSLQRATLHMTRAASARSPARQSRLQRRRLVRSATVDALRSVGSPQLHTTLKHVNQWMHVAHTCDQGRRKNMEDEYVVVENVNRDFHIRGTPFQSLFAIYDGHAGRGAVEWTAQHLHRAICAHGDFVGDPRRALRDAFRCTDQAFRAHAVEAQDVSGTTAIVALFRGDQVYVANAGDCRAVLCRGETAVDLSSDHKPHRADEQERVEAAGGWVESCDVLNIPKLYRLGLEDAELDDAQQESIGWVTVHRVNGALAMTRSIGDILIKDLKSDYFESAHGEFRGELIIADPEIQEAQLGPRDAFLLIACDGLWDVFTSQEAVDFVLEHTTKATSGAQSPRTRQQKVSELLVAEAIARGSLDNTSVIIIHFDQEKRARVRRIKDIVTSPTVCCHECQQPITTAEQVRLHGKAFHKDCMFVYYQELQEAEARGDANADDEETVSAKAARKLSWLRSRKAKKASSRSGDHVRTLELARRKAGGARSGDHAAALAASREWSHLTADTPQPHGEHALGEPHGAHKKHTRRFGRLRGRRGAKGGAKGQQRSHDGGEDTSGDTDQRLGKHVHHNPNKYGTS